MGGGTEGLGYEHTHTMQCVCVCVWGGLRGDRRDQRAQKRAGCQALRCLFLAAPWISVCFQSAASPPLVLISFVWKSAESTRSFWRQTPIRLNFNVVCCGSVWAFGIDWAAHDHVFGFWQAPSCSVVFIGFFLTWTRDTFCSSVEWSCLSLSDKTFVSTANKSEKKYEGLNLHRVSSAWLSKQQNNKETRIFFWFPSNCWPWLFCTRFPVWNYNQKTPNKKHSSATRICLFRPFSTTWNYLAMNEEPSST